MINAIAVWNTRYFEQAQAKLAQQGIPVPEEVWHHLSPLQWAHIHLNGSYHFSDVELEGDFRPLREYHGSRTRLAPRLESAETDAVLLQEEEDILPLQLSLLGEDEKDLVEVEPRLMIKTSNQWVATEPIHRRWARRIDTRSASLR